MIADMRRLGVDVSRFAAALTVFAFGGNVDIAAYTAGNTAQNNMLFLLFFALDAAGVIWTAYDIYNTISEIQEAIENGQDPSTIVQEKLVDLAFSLSLGKIQKSVIAAKSTAQLIINIRKHLEDVAPYLVKKFDKLAVQLSEMADGGLQTEKGTGFSSDVKGIDNWGRNTSSSSKVKITKLTVIPKKGMVISSAVTKKGKIKSDLIFANRNDALNWSRRSLGHSAVKTYNDKGQWIGWTNSEGDKVYWNHGDWGGGLGKSHYPHLNFIIKGQQGHLFLGDKIKNRGMWNDFAKELHL